MKATIVSYSLSDMRGDLRSWLDDFLKEITLLTESPADLILYPELFLAGLGVFMPELETIAAYLETELYPKIQGLMKGKDKLLILGTGPRRVDGKLFNSSAIFLGDDIFFQDKLFLTPWETDFSAGTELVLFTFQKMKTAVVICFDSEQPDLALRLKEAGVDLILVPSATTNRNGSQRVNRCASARAVELGAVVLTSPLVGQCSYDLVDHNEGRQGIFFPAQDLVPGEQEIFSSYSTAQRIEQTVVIDTDTIRNLKKPSSETKPFFKEIHPTLKVIKRNL